MASHIVVNGTIEQGEKSSGREESAQPISEEILLGQQEEDEPAEVTEQAVRDALRDVPVDDLSKKSPVEAGLQGVSVVVGVQNVTLRAGEGDWSRTTERALMDALSSVDGVGGVEVTEGGYDAVQAAGND